MKEIVKVKSFIFMNTGTYNVKCDFCTGMDGMESVRLLLGDKLYFNAVLGMPMKCRRHIIQNIRINKRSIEVNYIIVRPA